jgi:tellurite resistance protein TerC
MEPTLGWWIAFNAFVLAMLAIDLGVFHRNSHAPSVREALAWTGVWAALALAFNGWIWSQWGAEPALQFLTGWLIEKSLSIDNVFVFLLIFGYFQVPAAYRHKVLFWGIVGALVMRAAFIFAGVALMERFHWTIYLFGAILIASGVKLWLEKDREVHPDRNPVLRLFRRLVPVTPGFEGDRFFVRRQGRRWATPLFVTLLVVETTDVIFAIDSIPAILAVTQEPFIVYTSNAFAILGLRALFFALAGAMEKFHHLHYALSAILVFVGGKMMLTDVAPVPTPVSLAVVASLLVLGVVTSRWWPAHASGATKDPDDAQRAA